MTTSQDEKNLILKKRLNTFKSGKGSLFGLPDELVIEILQVWERWTGPSKVLCSNLGIKDKQLAFIIKKGKKLAKEGRNNLGPFVPVEVKTSSPSNKDKVPIILNWDKKKSIRFYRIDHLIEFLKKSA